MSNASFDKNSRPHRFFERYLSTDLDNAAELLRHQYSRIENFEMRGIKKNDYEDPFSYTKSVSTAKSREYNVFQIYYPFLHNLYSALVEMVVEGCHYYGVDYNSEQWMVAGWFNINSRAKGAKLEWHDHIPPEESFAAFHGYYSVSAEPSDTYYNINGQVKLNHNKNNRAVLSMVGYEHAMGPWDWEGDRITIAYDVIPMSQMYQLENEQYDKELQGRHMNWEQHFFPMPQLPQWLLDEWYKKFDSETENK